MQIVGFLMRWLIYVHATCSKSFYVSSFWLIQCTDSKWSATETHDNRILICIYFQPKDVFHVYIEVDPCQFIVYDRNFDGELTRAEVKSLFVDASLGERLFNDLDAIESKYHLRNNFTLRWIIVINAECWRADCDAQPVWIKYRICPTTSRVNQR